MESKRGDEKLLSAIKWTNLPFS